MMQGKWDDILLTKEQDYGNAGKLGRNICLAIVFLGNVESF